MFWHIDLLDSRLSVPHPAHTSGLLHIDFRHAFLSPTLLTPLCSYVDVLMEDLPFLALSVYVTQQLGHLNLQV